MELRGKVVLVTGASTGIGRAIARFFISEGARVIVFGLNRPDYNVEFHRVDVRKEGEIKKAMLKVGEIDVLVNNAGVAKLATVEKTSNELLNEVLDVNFKGVFWMCKHGIPKINQGGCIVNISSIAGLKSFESYSVYCASKAAVISLTKTLALELAKKKIRANCIAPGIIDTEIWGKMFGKEAKKELKEISEFVPLKRVGKPEEIAQAVSFLCRNEFANGSVVIVDGGETV